MRSGELARHAGVSADTIRHYERLGLLKPPQRTPSGYRDYWPESIKRVRLIRHALAVGFSLNELAGILRVRDRGGAPCGAVLETARSKLEQMDVQIKQLQVARRQLKLLLKNWSGRLVRTPKGRAARLLETLPEGMEENANAIHHRVHRNLRTRHNKPGPDAARG